LKEIDEDDYMQALDHIIYKKSGTLKIKNPIAKKMKLAAYGMSRGYEQDLVWSAVNRMVDAV